MLQELPEGRHFINPLFWSVETHKMVNVPNDKCVVLTRKFGKPIPPERMEKGEYLAGPDERGGRGGSAWPLPARQSARDEPPTPSCRGGPCRSCRRLVARSPRIRGAVAHRAPGHRFGAGAAPRLPGLDARAPPCHPACSTMGSHRWSNGAAVSSCRAWDRPCRRARCLRAETMTGNTRRQCALRDSKGLYLYIAVALAYKLGVGPMAL